MDEYTFRSYLGIFLATLSTTLICLGVGGSKILRKLDNMCLDLEYAHQAYNITRNVQADSKEKRPDKNRPSLSTVILTQ